MASELSSGRSCRLCLHSRRDRRQESHQLITGSHPRVVPGVRDAETSRKVRRGCPEVTRVLETDHGVDIEEVFTKNDNLHNCTNHTSDMCASLSTGWTL